MCEHCDFKLRPENGFPTSSKSGEVWYETDDAGERCGEACLLDCGGYWLCHGDKEHGYNNMLVRIRYCPCCGRDLMPDKIKSMYKVGDILSQSGEYRLYYYQVLEVGEMLGDVIYRLLADYGEEETYSEREMLREFAKVNCEETDFHEFIVKQVLNKVL